MENQDSQSKKNTRLSGFLRAIQIPWVNLTLRYGSAILVVIVAFWLYWVITGVFGSGLPTYILFYPAVIIVAILAGLGPGLLATVATLIVVGIWILPPYGESNMGSTINLVGYVIFGFFGTLISTVAELYRRNREKAAAYDKEMALRESEERLRRFYNSGLLGVIYWNIDGKIIDANDKFLEMMGYTREDLEAGRIDWVNMTPPEYRHLDEASMKELKATGVNKKPFEKEYVGKDGKRVPIIVAGAMLDDARHNGVAFVLDITDRKKTEEELRQAHDHLDEQVEERTSELEQAYESLKESELKFKTLADNSVDIIDRQDRQFRHLFVNNIIYKLLGIPPEGFIGKTNRELGMSEELVNLWESKTQEVFDTGKIGHMEFKLPTQNGINYYQSILVPEYNPNNEIESVLIISRDITERKQAEEQLKETINELERSNKELQSFAYITSHDLQEPLRTIASFTQLLERRYKGQLDENADEFMDYIVDAAVRMKDMIQGLLDYSRVDTQGEPFKEFNSTEAVSQALNHLHLSIEESKAEITYENLPTIIGDEHQIERVFQNLVGNALKFRKKEVKPKIHISTQKNNGEYIFSVQDNGIGMEEQYSKKIFEPFKRLHTIDAYEGTGIGLAVVKRIIEHHGGRIWFESELGVGSTFYFTIPVEPVKTGGGACP
ncbi:MAG: PAS domain S-box protein [Methanobacteriaceae archaeon]